MASLPTQQHKAIPIKDLSESMEASKDKKHDTDANHNVQKTEQTEEKGECRYCLDEQFVSKLEAPCGCNGSLKYAHRSCIAHWCNTKGDIMCEICKQPYSPNYSVTEPPSFDVDDFDVDEEWRIPSRNIRIQIPLQLADRGIDRPEGVTFAMAVIILIIAVMVTKDACDCEPPKDDKFSLVMYCVVEFIDAVYFFLDGMLPIESPRMRRREISLHKSEFEGAKIWKEERKARILQ